jgi:hypothetical protein
VAAVPESGIVVPVPLAEPVVGPWRAAWDSAADLGVPAHVTLLFPFLPPPVPEAAVAALRSLLATVAPWEAVFGSVRRFPGPVLYLAPADPAPFAALTERLVQRWPDCPPYGGAYDEVIPHLTVCEGAPEDVCAAASSALLPLLPLAAPVTEAWLMQQSEPGGRYSLVARLPFG